MPKFTEGPLAVHTCDLNGHTDITIFKGKGKSREALADVKYYADAVLWAAAPELYAALKAVEWIQDGESGTGEFSVCAWCGNWKADGHTKDCQREKVLNKAEGL